MIPISNLSRLPPNSMEPSTGPIKIIVPTKLSKDKQKRLENEAACGVAASAELHLCLS